MKAELIPDNGDPPIPITRDITVVGRRDYCDIRINHPAVSKRHCVLVRTDGLLILRDLASTNGTKVKGQRIRWAALLPGDRVGIGGYKVRVYLGPDDTPSPSEVYHRQPGPMITGFDPPTPPVVEPLGAGVYHPADDPLPESTDDSELIELGEDDLIEDGEKSQFEQMSAPRGQDEFFIELD